MLLRLSYTFGWLLECWKVIFVKFSRFIVSYSWGEDLLHPPLGHNWKPHSLLLPGPSLSPLLFLSYSFLTSPSLVSPFHGTFLEAQFHGDTQLQHFSPCIIRRWIVHLLFWNWLTALCWIPVVYFGSQVHRMFIFSSVFIFTDAKFCKF